MNNNFLEESELVKISKKLSKFDCISELNQKDNDPESWLIVLSLKELENTYQSVYSKIIPKLKKKELSNQEISNILLEIMEEYRHLLYHIKSVKSFSSLFNEALYKNFLLK